MADLVKFRYRGYYYDAETGFYYLQNRYYDPTICRFISADKGSLLSTLANSIGELNLYVYCNNNPIMYTDPTGEFWDTIFDLFFISLDIYNLCINDGYKNWENWLALGVDIAFAAIPFITSGGGQVVKVANAADNVMDMKRITIIGETMYRVENTANMLNCVDNLYSGFKYYDKLDKLGRGGKVLAEIFGKISNASWLYGKLRSGYKIIDIGIDAAKVGRSSSYILERLICAIWQSRNIWKLLYHL